MGKPEIENLKMRVFMTGLTAEQKGYAIEELTALLKYVAELEQPTVIASVSGSGHFVSQSCQGEKCFCGDKATHKLGEEIQHDEPNRIRHNLTAYVCCQHFQMVLGKAACASGAVDKTVSDGVCAHNEWVVRYGITQCAICGKHE